MVNSEVRILRNVCTNLKSPVTSLFTMPRNLQKYMLKEHLLPLISQKYLGFSGTGYQCNWDTLVVERPFRIWEVATPDTLSSLHRAFYNQLRRKVNRYSGL